MLEYRHDPPFKFTGTINKLTFKLDTAQVTVEQHEEMKKNLARVRD